MKKVGALFVTVLLFFVGMLTVNANGNIEATRIEVKDQSSTITVEDPTISNNEITSKITFNKAGDYVLFDVTLKNNKSSEYKIKEVTDNNKNSNLKIEYDYTDKIGAGGTGSLKIKMIYNSKSSQDITINDLIVTIEDIDGYKDTVLVNPETSDGISKYLIMLLVSSISLVFILGIGKKKMSKAFMLVIVSILLVPTVVLAKEKLALKFTNIEIKAATYVVKYDANDGSGEMEDQVMTYNVKANLTENSFTNGIYSFKEWNTVSDGSGTSYNDGEEVMNITDDDEITLYAIWNKISTFDTGSIVNVKMKNMANNSTSLNVFTVDNMVRAFKKADTLPNDFTATTDNTVSSSTSEHPIYIYFDSADGTMYYYSEADIMYLNANSERMFQSFFQLADISGLSDVNTSNVINMYGVLYNCRSLTNLDALSKWDTSKVTSMHTLFEACYNLTNIDGISSWNTSKVTDMQEMFRGISKITNLDVLSGWDTSSVTNMKFTFGECTNLSNIDALSSWDTSKVTTMKYTFYGCTSLTNIDALSSWDTSKVTDMQEMFYYCSNLSNIDGASSWDTSSVTDMESMFYGCDNLSNIDGASTWDTSSLTTMDNMFRNCSKTSGTFQILGNPTSYNYAFAGTATESGAQLTVNYSSSTTNIDNIIATKLSNSNVVKGVQVD